jgi:hypothetical protein
MTRARATLVTLSLSMLPAARAGADASARLVFVRDSAAAPSCPDERALRKAVEARLGYDPFLPWGSSTMVVRFEREGSAFVAKVELVAEGDSRGVRTLRSDDPGCAGLVDAAALAVSIALDAMRPAASPPPPPPPEDDSAPANAAPPQTDPRAAALPPGSDFAPPAPPLTEDSGSRPRPVFGLDFLVSDGSAPSVSTGLSLWGRLGWGREGTVKASLGVEARADFPSSGTEPSGGVSTWLAAGGLAPCLHLGPAFACAVGQLGALHGTGSDVRFPSSGSGLFATLGPRVGIELSLTSWVALRVRADALLNLARPTVDLNNAPAWRASLATGTLAAGFALRFP